MEIGKAGIEYIYGVDSIKFLSKHIRAVRYFKVACHPGISLTVSPFRCVVGTSRQHVADAELRTMDKAT